MEQDVVISKMTEKDLMPVFNLSNLSSVRAVSFNSEKIELENHKKWFASKLDDENTIMLKAEVGEDFAGQVRLSFEGDSAVIGVSVDEQFRGKGIASKLLQTAIAVANERSVKVIEAYIKPENAASTGLFEKNGFVYEDQTEVSGVPANRYLYKF